MPPKGRYWMRAEGFVDGWVLATVELWGGLERCAFLCGADGPFWPDELENAEWREISPPLD